MPAITLVEAVAQAMAYEMKQDPNVVALGEDIGINGGVFRATQGLQETFGPERIMDSPLAESMIAGLSVGMATQGLKPIAEFQFMGFIYPACNQIICHAARMRNRTRGRLTCPIVFRAPFGGGIHAPEHHSESTEALFAHIPGLKVVIPSSPKRAYGLLLAAIRDPDPVIFLEPKRIYRLHKQDVEDDGKALPIGKAFVLKEGKDLTLFTWGASVHETMLAAESLASQGIDAMVIDIASVKPLDVQTILEAAAITGRCLIVHEAPLSGGVGSEISALIAEHAIDYLLAPITRVTGYDTTMPYFKLEKHYIPSVKRISQAALNLMEYKA